MSQLQLKAALWLLVAGLSVAHSWKYYTDWGNWRTIPEPRTHPITRERTTPKTVSTPKANLIDVFPTDCGITNLQHRIFGGKKAGLGQFPWQAALFFKRNQEEERIMCGGALIHSRFVLTAAHCLTMSAQQGYTLTKVRLGELNVKTERDCEEEICGDIPQDFTVTQIPHQQYDGTKRQRVRNRHDIALLKLNGSAPFTDYIRPICVMRENEPLPDNNSLIIAGWGKTETARGSDHLLYVPLPYVESNQCSGKLRLTIPDTQVCAGGIPGEDSCNSDSGGPLIGIASNVYKVVGVLSYGAAGCHAGMPGVYTKVAPYVPWIRQTIQTAN